MIASLVARAWLYAGRETLLGPALVAGTFTFAAVALLATGLATLRSTSQGLLGGVVLLSTPFFLLHGTSLYADVPLAFFFLATIVCLALDDRYGADTGVFALLAGLAAGMAMWTKNEGLLFTLSVAAGLVLAGWRAERTGRRLRLFGLGLLPCLILVVTFKLAFAPPNDLLSTLGVGRTLGRLTAPARYLIVVREYTSHVSGFGANGFGSAVGVLAAYLLAIGPSPSETRRRWLQVGAAALVILLAGHFMVFVSMADELARLLRSSLDRLLLQLWPSALFLFFMAVRTPEEVGADADAPGRTAV
jgi:4-amino-4-deoxy-L-arabinose transferase-like glycosyltransferase